MENHIPLLRWLDSVLMLNLKFTFYTCGVIGILGFSMSFFTFGASTALIPIGAAIGATGSVIGLGSVLTELGISKYFNVIDVSLFTNKI